MPIYRFQTVVMPDHYHIPIPSGAACDSDNTVESRPDRIVGKCFDIDTGVGTIVASAILG